MTKRTRATRPRRASAIALAVSLACGAGSAVAADWSFDPRITLNAESDDNNRLTSTPGQEIEVAGAELDAQVTLRAETPRSAFRMVPRIRGTFYPNDEDEETDSQFLLMAYEFRGERSEAVLDAAYSRRETLGRYLPDLVDDDGGLGEPGEGDDLGNSSDLNRQERLAFTPDVTFDLTERVGLELGVGYLDVTFDEQVADDREDYNNMSADAGLRFRLSPTKSLTVRGRVSQYDPEDDVSTDAQSLVLEWANRVSETSQVFVRGGSNRVEEIDDLGNSEWNTGFTGGAGVRWSFEVTQVFFDAVRELDPNASGRLVERDQLRFRLQRRLGPMTTLLLAARGVRDGRTNNQDIFQKREYAAASAGFEWRMTRQFALGGGYEYVWRQIEGDPNDAVSNRLFLGVTWEPHRR